MTYEVTTMGDITIPPVVTTAAKTWLDLATGGPERRWLIDKTKEVRTFAAAEIKQLEAVAGKTLSKFDPRVMALKELGRTDPYGPFQIIGKSAAVASLGLVGYAIFSYLRKR